MGDKDCPWAPGAPSHGLPGHLATYPSWAFAACRLLGWPDRIPVCLVPGSASCIPQGRGILVTKLNPDDSFLPPTPHSPLGFHCKVLGPPVGRKLPSESSKATHSFPRKLPTMVLPHPPTDSPAAEESPSCARSSPPQAALGEHLLLPRGLSHQRQVLGLL